MAEGGNLGLTQRARIEFAREGGLINADFIDNSAGVDCSDHEVNLKVLLDLAVRRGELDAAERDALLAEVTEDVAAHVLYDSFLQAQMLAQEVRGSATRMFAYEDLMAALEAEGLLQREVEFLPSSEEMADRRRSGRGLERPELAVLLAYAKRSLTGALLRSSLPDDAYLEGDLRGYFPPAVVERLGHLLGEHPLRRELVATIVSNHVVNALGPDLRLAARRRAGRRAGRRRARLPHRPRRHRRRAALGRDRAAHRRRPPGAVEADGGRRRARRGHGALVPRERPRGRPGHGDRHRARGLRAPAGAPAQARRSGARRAPRAAAELVEQGVPDEMAHAHAYLPALGYAPDVIAAAGSVGRSVEDAGMAFVLLEDRVQIAWIEEQLDALPVSTRMQRWALQALRDDLWRARRELACKALRRRARRAGRGRRRALRRRPIPTRCGASPTWRARWRGRAAPTSPA